MHYLSILVLFLYSTSFAQSPYNESEEYPNQVGDISFDPLIDSESFWICDEKNVHQYYNFGNGLQFSGEKPALEKHFNKEKLTGSLDDHGYITIRFIVNCKGETGRFRIQMMDFNYQPYSFSSVLAEQLLQITKNISGWQIATYQDHTFDYYQYLTFKIERGQLTAILP